MILITLSCRTIIILSILLLLPFTAPAEEKNSFKERHNLSFVGVPIVTANPSFGNGGGASGMVVFDYNPAVKGVPPSMIAVSGLYTDRSSHFAGVFSRLYPNEKWRFKLGAGNVLVKNQLDLSYYPTRTDFSTTVNGALAEGLYVFFSHFYAGVKAVVKDISYSPDNESGAAYLEDADAEDLTSGSFGPVATYDTRDNTFFPYEGIYSELAFIYHPEFLGNETNYFELEGFLNGYKRLRSNHTLASRMYARFTPNGTPYADLSTLGRRSDLRGYVSGEHIGNHLIDLQVEYRYQFLQRWTAVGFIGGAALFDNYDLNSDDLYMSAGGGLRYMLNTERRINLRVDFAVGEGDSRGFYIGLSEAF